MEYDDVEVRFHGNIVANVEQLSSVELSIVVTLLYDEYVEWHGGLLQKGDHGWHELVQMLLPVLLHMQISEWNDDCDLADSFQRWS